MAELMKRLPRKDEHTQILRVDDTFLKKVTSSLLEVLPKKDNCVEAGIGLV